jgi:hypothetical protein
MPRVWDGSTLLAQLWGGGKKKGRRSALSVIDGGGYSRLPAVMQGSGSIMGSRALAIHGDGQPIQLRPRFGRLAQAVVIVVDGLEH